MNEKIKRNIRIERLVDFIKKYPELWGENRFDLNNENLLKKHVDEYMSEKECEESREDLIQKLKDENDFKTS